MAPSFLFTDGQGLLVGDMEKLREPLAPFLGDGVDSLLSSAELGNELFLELRAVGPADQRPDELARVLQLRLEKLSEQLEAYVAALQPGPYGRLVVIRFPRMVQLLSDYTRSGAENREAVLRCYLPGAAAHNLLLASQLTLLEQPAAAAAEAPAPAKVAPPSAAAALEKRIKLSFPRDTLERCLDLLSKEIDVPVVILGGDLQLEGITKNQSFGLDERDQVARDVLDKVLALANADGKLVYVIKLAAGRGRDDFHHHPGGRGQAERPPAPGIPLEKAERIAAATLDSQRGTLYYICSRTEFSIRQPTGACLAPNRGTFHHPMHDLSRPAQGER